MDLARLNQRLNRRFARSRLLDDPEEIAAVHDGQAIGVQRCQKSRVELLGVDFTVASVGPDDRDFALDAVGNDEGAASGIGDGLNQLFDVDVLEVDVEAFVFPESLASGDGLDRTRMLVFDLSSAQAGEEHNCKGKDG